MRLADPFWLVLAIPLAMALWRWRLPSRLMQGMRLVASLLLLLALCGLSVRLPSRSGTAVLVMDRSLSMPSDSAAVQQEAADLVHGTMRSGDTLAIVSFAETAAVEQSPQQAKFTGFAAEVGGEASHLADAIDLGLSLIGRDESGRLLVLSDGKWTGRDIDSVGARAAAAEVAIDYRLMERRQSNDLAIERIDGPQAVMPGESFMISAWLDAPRGQSISYQLFRGSKIIARGRRDVGAGMSRLVFRDTASEQGVSSYRLRVEGEGDDPVPENNRARLLVGVQGARPVLCINTSGESGLPPLLANGGLDVQSASPSDHEWTLEELAGYAAVVLENTPASAIGHVGMQNLAAWVSESGGGLMFTGGKNSYGPGGYFKSPLDSVMPVSMELRREHRKLSLAVVVALDRSGSMAMTVPGGRVKMDLANLATAEVVEMLGALDQFGCVAVDSTPHEIVGLRDVTDRGAIRNRASRTLHSSKNGYTEKLCDDGIRLVRRNSKSIGFGDSKVTCFPSTSKRSIKVWPGREHSRRRFALPSAGWIKVIMDT
ncbi:MAG: VWA domain-containing protein [Planctomycetota bacterium]